MTGNTSISNPRNFPIYCNIGPLIILAVQLTYGLQLPYLMVVFTISALADIVHIPSIIAQCRPSQQLIKSLILC